MTPALEQAAARVLGCDQADIQAAISVALGMLGPVDQARLGELVTWAIDGASEEWSTTASQRTAARLRSIADLIDALSDKETSS